MARLPIRLRAKSALADEGEKAVATLYRYGYAAGGSCKRTPKPRQHATCPIGTGKVQEGRQFPPSQSPTRLWVHPPVLCKYLIRVCVLL